MKNITARTLSVTGARRQMMLLRMGTATLLAAGAITAWGLLNPASAQNTTAPAPAAASAPAHAMQTHDAAHHREGRRGERHAKGHDGMHGPEGMGMMGGRQLDRMLDGLKVTAEQRTQIKTIADKARLEARTLHEQGRDLHRAWLDQLTQSRIDPAMVKAAHDKIVAQHQKMSDRMGAAQLEIAQVLSPEQRVQMRERMTRMMDRMHDRR